MKTIKQKLILLAVLMEMLFACNNSGTGNVSNSSMPGKGHFVSDTLAIANNKNVVRQLHEEVWSKGKINLIDALYNANMVCHVPLDSPWTTIERLKQVVINHRAAFPDWKEEITRLIAEEDWVVSKYRVSGTQKGIFWDIAPSGNAIAMEEVVVFRFENGKIAEQWSYPNLYEYRRQLLNGK
ncbi:ester cyclase [Sphingobacteriales bacterium UPWRP_1]|nr:hypothetical protein BVG80_09740 [Sphingobacteriales bacterium TSM_CSM]PSJ78109.1 ester cyclase [Sphingobacteriales bacterium UPWRP_1]